MTKRLSDACGRGICAAKVGHAGTCAEASVWADEPAIPTPEIDVAATVQALRDRVAEAKARREAAARKVHP